MVWCNMPLDAWGALGLCLLPLVSCPLPLAFRPLPLVSCPSRPVSGLFSPSFCVCFSPPPTRLLTLASCPLPPTFRLLLPASVLGLVSPLTAFSLVAGV